MLHAGGMALHSHADLPVLEEWYDGGVSGRRLCDRPHACGVVGCAEPLVKVYHLKSRLCPAHIKCPAVLRRGTPQRWCAICHRLHALMAFSGSRRYAPTSSFQRCVHVHKVTLPARRYSCALCSEVFQPA